MNNKVFKSIWAITILLLIANSKIPSRQKAVEEALTYVKVNPQGVSFNLSYAELDTFRLKSVNYLLAHPLYTLDFADSNTQSLERYKGDVTNLYLQLLKLGDIEQSSPIITRGDEEFPWKNGKYLTSNIKEGLDIIYSAIKQSNELLAGIIDSLSQESRDSLYKFLPRILEMGKDETEQHAELTPQELDSLEKEEIHLNKRIFQIASQISRDKLAESAALMIYASSQALQKLEGSSRSIQPPESVNCPIASGDIVYYSQSPYGNVIIGGAGETVYSGRFAIIIDLGGDDIYNCPAGGVDTTSLFSIAIDLSGNDLYISHQPFAFGSAFLGTGILIDRKGNDFYQTQNYGIASGLLGCGLLWDKDGDDTYKGNAVTIGSGYLGQGILLDEKGEDTYIGNVFCQGFGFVGGLGLLLDIAGNDNYTAQGKYPDRLREREHNLSMAQGFGFGLRPWYSGGAGILLDLEGNDNYRAELFAQGSSYWYALGMLVDRDGVDNYQAYRYTQGCGTHMTVGCLIDDGKQNDSYLSYLVSQGCGHDLAIGVLNDRGGDDSYIISELSQGAGNANGIGMFIDEDGVDSYIVRTGNKVQGFGNFRREYGSLGLMLDLRGMDKYIGGRGNQGEIWRNGKYGIGIDFESTE